MHSTALTIESRLAAESPATSRRYHAATALRDVEGAMKFA